MSPPLCKSGLYQKMAGFGMTHGMRCDMLTTQCGSSLAGNFVIFVDDVLHTKTAERCTMIVQKKIAGNDSIPLHVIVQQFDCGVSDIDIAILLSFSKYTVSVL